MLFNSIEFAIFCPLVFSLYWLIKSKNLKFRNFLILIASYIFYGWWDWRFLILLFLSTFSDYIIGLNLKKNESEKTRKALLWISILINLGALGFFKYYNFFIDNFVSAFTLFGEVLKYDSLKIILPVGISFYTFQTLSYTIDVYRRKIEPSYDLISFLAFISFFPQLVAGPIERAANLLPQFSKHKTFNYSFAVNGMRQILWGLFKKVVIADNCAIYANEIFNNSNEYSGTTLLLGAILFAMQIYGDFSGYSDIAIGVSRLFGFDLMQNFAFPYFSRDIAEFWRRWHISLSTWFRDYIYIPIGGSRGSALNQIRNVFLIFIISGFWHGANWTFIAWGALHGIYFLPLLLFKDHRKNLEIVAKGKTFPRLKELIDILKTFLLTTIAWILFRSESIEQASHFIHDLLSGLRYEWGYIQTFNFISFRMGGGIVFLLVTFVAIEWLGREAKFALENLNVKLTGFFRFILYYFLIFSIFWFKGVKQEFIYFQF